MDKEQETEHPEECKGKAHYWVLDAKNLGICKKCGAKKQFNVQESGWQRRQIVVVKNSPVIEAVSKEVRVKTA